VQAASPRSGLLVSRTQTDIGVRIWLNHELLRTQASSEQNLQQLLKRAALLSGSTSSELALLVLPSIKTKTSDDMVYSVRRRCVAYQNVPLASAMRAKTAIYLNYNSTSSAGLSYFRGLVNRARASYVPFPYCQERFRKLRTEECREIRPLPDELPAISVTSPGPSNPTSSPATLEALDDSRLTSVPLMPRLSESAPIMHQPLSTTTSHNPSISTLLTPHSDSSLKQRICSKQKKIFLSLRNSSHLRTLPQMHPETRTRTATRES
jgi:hypothetical protein